jgi:F-type H+-transporting ATPase subunit a
MHAPSAYPEFPHIIGFLAAALHGTPVGRFLIRWEIALYSCMAVGILSVSAWLISARIKTVPGRIQAAAELVVGTVDDFVCGIIGPKGRRFVPFIGTLFLYILTMNIMGLIPFLKSATSSLSVTFALALCVFVYVQFTAFKELGFIGYFDHLCGRPRGVMVLTLIMPVMMFVLHLVAELIRPLSLSLRLRSNIWGDDLLLATLADFGIKGFPLYFVNLLTVVMAGVIQAFVFTLLTTVYLALVLEEEHA